MHGRPASDVGVAGLLAQSFEANLSHEQRSGKESTQGGDCTAAADERAAKWDVPQGVPVQPTSGNLIEFPLLEGVEALVAGRRFIACSCSDAHRLLPPFARRPPSAVLGAEHAAGSARPHR